MINLTQFEATFWPQHNTQWQWSKISKIMTLVWSMQMWKSWRKSQINATNATLHLLRQAIWGYIWKRTVEKSQTNAASASLPALTQVLWRDIWRGTDQCRQKEGEKLHVFHFEQMFERTNWIFFGFVKYLDPWTSSTPCTSYFACLYIYYF